MRKQAAAAGLATAMSPRGSDAYAIVTVRLPTKTSQVRANIKLTSAWRVHAHFISRLSVFQPLLR